MLRLRRVLHLRPVDRDWCERCVLSGFEEARRHAPPSGRFAAVGKTGASVSATAAFSSDSAGVGQRAVVEGAVRTLLTATDIAEGRVEVCAGSRPPAGRLEGVYQVIGGRVKEGSLSAVRLDASCDTAAWWERGAAVPIVLNVTTRPLDMEMRIGPPQLGAESWQVPVETTISGMWWMAAVVLVALNRPGRRIRALYRCYLPDQGPDDPANVSGGIVSEPVLPGQAMIEERLRRALVTVASEWNRMAPDLAQRDPADLVAEKAESWSRRIRQE